MIVLLINFYIYGIIRLNFTRYSFDAGKKKIFSLHPKNLNFLHDLLKYLANILNDNLYEPYLPNNHLRFGILAFDAAHIITSRFR